jgi:hypothetical protein
MWENPFFRTFKAPEETGFRVTFLHPWLILCLLGPDWTRAWPLSAMRPGTPVPSPDLVRTAKGKTWKLSVAPKQENFKSWRFWSFLFHVLAKNIFILLNLLGVIVIDTFYILFNTIFYQGYKMK